MAHAVTSTWCFHLIWKPGRHWHATPDQMCVSLCCSDLDKNLPLCANCLEM